MSDLIVRILRFGALVLVLHQLPLLGRSADVSTQLIQTYKYVLTQDALLDAFVDKHSDLALRSRAAQARFHQSSLGRGYLGVLEALDDLCGGRSDEYMAPMKQRLEEQIQKTNFSLSYAEALVEQVYQLDISSVDQFAVTIPAEEVLATLLLYSPDYKSNTLKEYLDGWAHSYSSKGNLKAKGAKFQILFPASWKVEVNTDTPNVVCVATNEFGEGFVSCNILVFDVGSGVSEAKMREMFDEKVLWDTAQSLGRAVEAKSITMVGRPAGLIVVDAKQQIIDETVSIRMSRFAVVLGDQFIALDFMESSVSGVDTYSDQEHSDNHELFKLIAGSLVSLKDF